MEPGVGAPESNGPVYSPTRVLVAVLVDTPSAAAALFDLQLVLVPLFRYIFFSILPVQSYLLLLLLLPMMRDTARARYYTAQDEKTLNPLVRFLELGQSYARRGLCEREHTGAVAEPHTSARQNARAPGL